MTIINSKMKRTTLSISWFKFPLVSKLLMLVIFMSISNFTTAQNTPEQELESIENQIEAIRIKRTHVQNDPSQHSQALTDGWYGMVTESLKRLADKKRIIVLDQTGKNFISLEEFEMYPQDKKDKLLISPNHIIEQP
jgi:hypothetical protein